MTSIERVNQFGGKHRDRYQTQQPLPAELHLLRGHVEIHQHDDKQKQHHDAANVEYHLDGKQELGVQHQVNAAHRKQRDNQPYHTVHRVPPGDHQNRRAERRGR